MPKCKVCGKSMKNDFAMKIHMGRMHKDGRSSSTRKRRGIGQRKLPSGDLSSVTTSALLGELRRRAAVYDQLKILPQLLWPNDSGNPAAAK